MHIWVQKSVSIQRRTSSEKNDNLEIMYKTETKKFEFCTQVQPATPTWNLMGMMNNAWFRVKVKQVPGEAALWFEHPTRVEKNIRTAWRKENLYVLLGGY